MPVLFTVTEPHAHAERIYKMKDRLDRSYTLSGGITAAVAVLARSASP